MKLRSTSPDLRYRQAQLHILRCNRRQRAGTPTGHGEHSSIDAESSLRRVGETVACAGYDSLFCKGIVLTKQYHPAAFRNWLQTYSKPTMVGHKNKAGARSLKTNVGLCPMTAAVLKSVCVWFQTPHRFVALPNINQQHTPSTGENDLERRCIRHFMFCFQRSRQSSWLC